eukprot:CAMPEP_0182565862 /NCGR_PEP_ID=MMETSP1324-20130603/7482_1 /TAXON_ID=236786 /ORGANISM="Florenciella sp., Strain RCC1587" /LENGTH=293 /DNA_ID=CAMNT_0024779585 /DNA_START=5 /DNA_END=886 /DNA_ORIENTATION=+
MAPASVAAPGSGPNTAAQAPRHIFILTTARCKSTISLRILAGTWGDVVCEPFTQAYYRDRGADVPSVAWPDNYDDGKKLLRERVARADVAGRRLVAKDLAYQALPGMLDAEFLGWVRETFHIIYLTRKPRDIALSIGRHIEKTNEPPSNFVGYTGLAELHATTCMLPGTFENVEATIDPDPASFIRRSWAATAMPLAPECEPLPSLPILSAEEQMGCGFNLWPAWYDKAVGCAGYEPGFSENKTLPPLGAVFQREVDAHLPLMEMFMGMVHERLGVGVGGDESPAGGAPAPDP